MPERRKALQERKEAADELTFACTRLMVQQAYGNVVDEPVPKEMLDLLQRIDPATRPH